MKVCLRFWITKENKSFLGKGRVELLKHIKQTGSISKAAKNMKMSYKAAWDSIDSMNNHSSKNLVESNSGGKGGGGSFLSPSGEEAIEVFEELEKMFVNLQNIINDPKNELNDIKELKKRIKIFNQKISNF